MITNLPINSDTDSGSKIRSFFDKFFLHQVSFPVVEIDAVITFFLKRGFSDSASQSIAIVLLTQARADDVNVFALLDSLKGLTDVQLSQVVSEVLNVYREKTSALGYKTKTLADTYESRNILV
jgi:hypothetical protein